MRYEKQIAVPFFGENSQRVLEKSKIAIIGCGALGCLQAEMLVRMGVGKLLIADGDHVTIGNLHRQLLFTESHAADKRLKVEAAKEELLRIDRGAEIQISAEFITPANIEGFIKGADIVLDALDAVATRFLINDRCLKYKIPWIYTGIAGTQGMIMPITPGSGPCLRCLYPHPPSIKDSVNCVNSGILPLTVTMAVSIQLSQAIKILTGNAEAGTLIKFDCMKTMVRKIKVPAREECICRRRI